MNSIRERILREVVARLTAGVAPTPVVRFPTVPVTREASPALLLFAEGDSISAHANNLVDRLLMVRLVAVARGDHAFDQADLAVVAADAHALIDEQYRIFNDEVMPALGVDLKLVQLLDGGDENLWMQTEDGVRQIAQYADGLGPEKSMIIGRDSTADNLQISGLVGYAHANGLQVHPYTFRADAGQVPAYASSFEHMLELFYVNAEVDGVFTDFTDRAVAFIRNH